MTKTEFIAIIAKDAGLSKKDAEKALAATLDGIKKALKKGDKVQFVGFGTFETRKRAARKVRNPRTGETKKVAATKVPAFKPGKALKEAVK